MYKVECKAGSEPVVQDEAWLTKFFDKFFRQIRLWFETSIKPIFYDDMLKNFADLLCSINCYGEEGSGAGAAPDKVNEWAVEDIKKLYDRFSNRYEVTLIDRAMKANNMIASIKEHFMDSLGESKLGARGGHSQDYFKEERTELREEVRNVSPLCPDPDREKVKYGESFRDLCGELTVEKVTEMIVHKAMLYKCSRIVIP